MEEKKSIYACYEEIKQREISELKDAIKAHGGKFVFDPDVNAPEVLCNLKYGGPADVRIMSVSIDDQGFLTIIGQERGESGCADWYESETEISLSEIAYGHIEFITNSIPKKKHVLSDETSRLCETVAELSNILYRTLYFKFEDTFAVCGEIRRLAVKFEESFDKDKQDFILAIDQFAKDYAEKELNL